MGDSPFTQYAGQTTIIGAKKDAQGNADGTQYDLAKDGAFDGKSIVVLHLYTGEGFDFVKPQKALEEKGFNVVRFTAPPSPDVLRAELDKATQVWVISSQNQVLSEQHIDVISEFFHKGKGVYIWGDNQPYYVDANRVAQRLIECSMSGNWHADKVVNEAMKDGDIGFMKHQITTGLEFLYEGITVAEIHYPEEKLYPILRGSDGRIVSGCYDSDGKRAILDGGFTRLFLKWDDAGTARFVKNAAAWLVNRERFNKQKQRPQTLAQQSTFIDRTKQNKGLNTQLLPKKNQQAPSLQKQTSDRNNSPEKTPQDKPRSLRSQGSQWNKD